MAKADEVLRQNGWRMTSHPESLDHPEKLQVIGYEDSAGILPLEIHPTWSGTGSPQQAKENARFAGADERAITVEIGGMPLLSLNAADHYLYLYLHLVKHFEIAGVGLRQMLDLAQFREMDVFMQFSSDLDETTRRRLMYGQGLMRLLRQPQYKPYSQSDEVILLVSALGRAFEGVPAAAIYDRAAGLLEFMRGEHPEIASEIDRTGELTPELSRKILAAAREYGASKA